ncbi:MAG TPA: hypothetical protein VMH91_01410 [Candidatus Paceibacterota bacterium]|nr:hypothetical protein [Candidatus Paceibacterota bacterium]
MAAVSTDRLFYPAWAIVIALALFFLAPEAHTFATNVYEDMAYAVDPSASRAFAYGERHFDATNPSEYDLDRAEYFFTLAAKKDPSTPYLYHELARISFLRGDYKQALARIDFQIMLHGDSEPNSYYVRGLIEGYMRDYGDAITDYTHFLLFDPNDWAAINDDAWVLLKAGRFQEAADLTTKGLKIYPENPWLLNSNATALYELGLYQPALAAAEKAEAAVATVTDSEWSHAYPGNDPTIAGEGVASFRQAVADNVHTIQLALATSTVQ